MNTWGKSLKYFLVIPQPTNINFNLSNNMLLEELSYNRLELRSEHLQLVSKLIDEQKNVHDTILHDVQSNLGGLYFVYGYGGTGMTFVWRTLSATLRSEGDIVLNIASSGIASLLLPGGHTAHSEFSIPIAVNEEATCKIR